MFVECINQKCAPSRETFFAKAADHKGKLKSGMQQMVSRAWDLNSCEFRYIAQLSVNAK